jgi:sigma-B regulation protein RsbU (phosphoserine phosphatase)
MTKEEPFQHKTLGEMRWSLTTKVPLKDEAGNVVGLIGIARDITQQKRAEEVLRQSHEELEKRVTERTAELSAKNAELGRANASLATTHRLLQAMLDNVPDRIYFKDTQSRFIRVSRSVAKRVGVADPAEVIGKTDSDFYSPELAKKFCEDDENIIRSGKPIINKTEMRTDPDGETTWTSTTKLPLRDEQGKVVGLVGIGRDITEQKRAEEALRQSHERLEQQVAKRTAELSKERLLLRTLIDNLPDGIYAKDAAGRKTLANPADLKVLGCKTETEAIGKTDFDHFPKDIAEKFWADDQKVLQGQPVINREEYFLDEAGQKRWLLTSKLPLRDQDGKIVGLIGIGRDITRRKQMEDKLAYEQELFRTLLDNLPDAIYFKDRESRFVRVSRSKVEKSLATARQRYHAACPAGGREELPPHLAGLEPFAEYMVGKTDFDFYTEERARPAYEDEQEIIRTGQPSIGKLERATQPDGEVNWVITTKMPWRDKGGNIIGTFGVSRDITALKEAEEKLAERTEEVFQRNVELAGVNTSLQQQIAERERVEQALAQERRLLRTLIDNLPDCIYAKDTAGRKTLANPADLKNFGCKTEAEAIGKNDFDLFPKDIAEKFWADDQKVIQGQPVINREEYFLDEAGRKRWLLTSKLPLRDQGGKIVGLVGIGHDITERKRVEQALAERTQELEQKNKQITEELKMARELQLAMLPHEFPCVPPHKPREESDLEFFSFFFPIGAVSGDFFDVLPLSDTAVGLFICDVMGHDVRAALVTAMMRALVVDLSATTTDPGELLAQINREVAGVFKQTGSTMYATAFYLIADVARGELRYASAAHPEPLLLRRQQGTAEWLGNGAGQKKGPALGLFAEGQFPTYRRPLEVGDLIALFTDGLIEAEGADHEPFSAERLLAAVRQRTKLPAKELFTGLLDEIKRFTTHSEFEDDVCVVGMEVKRLETGDSNLMV